MEVINDVATLDVADGIATLEINSPPVNALSAKVRIGLDRGFRQALADPAIAGIVLICAGRTFFAGADITEFDQVPQEPDLRQLQTVIEAADKPVVAAIHGTALGGGLEVALTCHFRVAVPSAKVGLPEVALGLLPGAGGTQRLPRIVGAAQALDIMAFGRPLGAKRALELGLLDAIVEEGKLHDEAVLFLRQAIADRRPLTRVRDRDEKLAEARATPDLFDNFRQVNTRAFRGFKAPENIIQAVEAAVNLPFDAGMARESALFLELLTSTESAAQRYGFFGERQVNRIPDISDDTRPLPVKSVGVVGAGTMGGGIAMNFLNIGIPVTIVEQKQAALDHGVAAIRRNYETTVRKGRLSAAALEERMALLKPTLDFNDLGRADLVIEAVFENLELKQKIFAQLDGIAAPHAILASNTSFLDLDAIAAATSRPDRVVGLHFFSPANVMRLLEVVRGEKTAKEVLATAMQIGRKIGKVTVVSRVCDGFIANRMMAPRSAVANELILEGPMPWDIDRVMLEFGFPMGPFAMSDLVGLDVIGWDAATTSSASVLEVLCEQGRWGQKKGAGFYDYDDNRKATPSAVTERIILDFSARQGIQRRMFTDQEIIERLLLPVVNEGARILEEGIALRGSDIDVALMTGYGWPIYTGGPLFWADTFGLGRIVEKLDGYSERYGPGYAPAQLLKRLAETGGLLQNFKQG